MAVQISVNRFTRKLEAAIRRYATNHGVARDHITIVGEYDRTSGLIYVTVGVDLPIDQSAWIAGIRSEVRDEFSGHDPIITQYYLMVCQVANLDMIYDRINDGDDLEAIDLT